MLLALGVFTLSNIISMLTSNFTVLLIARVLPAFLHPVYVSMAFTVAAASVSKEKAPKAVAKVFIGVSAGMVLGVPVTSYIASEVSFTMGMAFLRWSMRWYSSQLFFSCLLCRSRKSYPMANSWVC